MHTTAVSTTISQAAALPTQVLMPSMVWRKRSTVMLPPQRSWGGGAVLRRRRGHAPSLSYDPFARCAGTSPRMTWGGKDCASAITLQLHRLGVGAPVVVERHLAAHHRVLLPLGGALGEGQLR